MVDYFINIDRSLFIFINQIISNNLFDNIMPIITDWDKTIIGRIIILLTVVIFFWKGGSKGRFIIVLLIATIILSDVLNSQVLKNIFLRPRPCHVIDGAYAIQNVHLLVPCGKGYSFPSSHAVNNFALATVLTMVYKKAWWIFGMFATLIGFSRIYVGVHYPADVVVGAFIGIFLALLMYFLSLYLIKKFRFLKIFLIKTFSKLPINYKKILKITLLSFSGILLGFSFPPFDTGFLAAVAFIPFLLAISDVENYGQVFRYSYFIFF